MKGMAIYLEGVSHSPTHLGEMATHLLRKRWAPLPIYFTGDGYLLNYLKEDGHLFIYLGRIHLLVYGHLPMWGEMAISACLFRRRWPPIYLSREGWPPIYLCGTNWPPIPCYLSIYRTFSYNIYLSMKGQALSIHLFKRR